MSVTSLSGAHRRRSSRTDPPAHLRILCCGAVGALAALVVGLIGPWWLVPLSGWVVAALGYVGWMLHTVWRLDAKATLSRALREEPGRATTDALLLGAAVISLLAVGLVLVRAGQLSGAQKLLLVGLSGGTVVLSWSVVHTVHGLRYARIYYKGAPGGVNFNEHEAPSYTDFAYLALTIGMTFQVSDTNLTNKTIRKTALKHALLSYMFGAIFIAITLNLIAGMSK